MVRSRDPTTEGARKMNASGGHAVPTYPPALYEITIRGALDESWSQLMDGMTLTVGQEGDEPVTILRVVVPDQAALAGLLDSLFRLNTTVLSVEAIKAT
jgi:hypothetical protein